MMFESPEEKIEALKCKVESLESKLAKAVKALEVAQRKMWKQNWNDNYPEELALVTAALAEIKGE